MIPLSWVRTTQKKWGFHRCSVKKCRFSGQKWAPAAGPRPAVQRGQHKNVVLLVSSHDGNKKFGQFPKKMDFGPKKCIFGPKICIWPIRWKYKKRVFSAIPRCPIFKFFVVTGEVFLHFLALMPAPVNLFSIFPLSRELCPPPIWEFSPHNHVFF